MSENSHMTAPRYPLSIGFTQTQHAFALVSPPKASIIVLPKLWSRQHLPSNGSVLAQDVFVARNVTNDVTRQKVAADNARTLDSIAGIPFS
jgi:hypothetical protein